MYFLKVLSIQLYDILKINLTFLNTERSVQYNYYILNSNALQLDKIRVQIKAPISALVQITTQYLTSS